MQMYATNILPVVGIIFMSHLMLIKKCLLSSDGSMPNIEVIQEGRRTGNLKIKRFKTVTYEKDVLCYGAQIYNQLPIEIRELTSITKFKQKCKGFLLDKKDLLLQPGQIRNRKLN